MPRAAISAPHILRSPSRQEAVRAIFRLDSSRLPEERLGAAALGRVGTEQMGRGQDRHNRP